MRIGIFIDTYFPMIDGVIVCVDNYARYLSRYADVTVFTTVAGKDCDDSGRPYRVVRCFSLPVPGEDYVVPTPAIDPEFIDELLHSNLDIVHINSPFTVGKAGLRYARRRGIPAVATMHSQFRTDFTRALKAEPLVELALSEIMKVFNGVDEVWVPNSAVARVYKEYGGVLEPVLRSNATDMLPVEDTARARRRINIKYGLDDNDKVLLFVGRLVRQKNILLIADGLKELKRLSAKPFRMLFVGSGPDEEELRRHISDIGVENMVTFTGRVSDRRALAEIYSRSDLFLFPSLYDTNSLVQIEAASQKTPTLFLNGAVTSATVEPDVSGWFADESAEEYAAKIIEIFSDDDKYKAVSEGAFRDVYVTWETVTDGMYSGFERLISENKKEGQE